jgi:C4-dicarboxylate-specific signal transduction histidine kinase
VTDHSAVAVRHDLSWEDLVRINRTVLVASVVRGTVHTVNNILQTIGGQAEMLGQRPEQPDDVRRRTERIAAQTSRAAAYMRELSALTRDVPEAPDRADVRQCIDRVFALREYDLQREHIRFDIQVDPSAPRAARIDVPALTMILLNLILNAEQSQSGMSDAMIAVAVTPAQGRLMLGVQDAGPGVSPDVRDHVFEPFFTTGCAGATLGLGLTVASHLATQHGGHVRLADDQGPSGARFDLELPAVV